MKEARIALDSAQRLGVNFDNFQPVKIGLKNTYKLKPKALPKIIHAVSEANFANTLKEIRDTCYLIENEDGDQ